MKLRMPCLSVWDNGDAWSYTSIQTTTDPSIFCLMFIWRWSFCKSPPLFLLLSLVLPHVLDFTWVVLRKEIWKKICVSLLCLLTDSVHNFVHGNLSLMHIFLRALFLFCSLRCPKGYWWDDKYLVVNALTLHFDAQNSDLMNDQAVGIVRNYIDETETLLNTNRWALPIPAVLQTKEEKYWKASLTDKSVINLYISVFICFTAPRSSIIPV